MQSPEYRRNIRVIVKNVIRKRFPGLKQQKELEEVATEIAKSIHARLYGANVDSVETPIWREIDPDYGQPNRTAQEILDD